jgi:uncharacterized protein (DUF2249 family)
MTTTAIAQWTLDLAAFPPEEVTTRALAAFDSLAPGERLLLRAVSSPLRLLNEFQSARKGLFEWSVVEAGPDSWKVEVFRRDAPAGQRRGIGEGLAWDHDRLDSLESAAFSARSAGDFAAARDHYARFACGLRRHIGFEEEILFPAFEEKTGLDPTCGPTSVMRLEHGEIQFLLGRIEHSIGDPDADVLGMRRRFHEVLSEHDEKEEAVLYPAADGLFQPDDADALFALIQRFGM